MKASDYIAEFLVSNGVSVVTEMCGGMTTHMLDSLSRRPEVRIVPMHHEQAAAFAAEAVARMSGVPGVSMATSGPGATNLITGIGSCYFDSTPALFITGQVNTHELRGDSAVRQAGFQETDIVAMVAAITKGAWQVPDAAELPRMLEDAFRLALEGRPGPVLLDIPMNVQRQEVDALVSLVASPVPAECADIEPLIAALSAARTPLVLAGGGVRSSGAVGALRRFVEQFQIPVVTSLMGVDVLPFGHPERVGLIGSYGNRWGNLVMAEADLLLILGARLDVRQTGADLDAFRSGKTIVQVDLDEKQLEWRITPDIAIRSDIGTFLAALEERSAGISCATREEWHRRIAEIVGAWPIDGESRDVSGIDPLKVVERLAEAIPTATAYVTDVGQNQMWAAQAVRLHEDQRFLTSGGMGAMGFGLPAAIGVALAESGRPVIVISGDGGMQVNLQELETVARLGLELKIVVFDNKCLGMVRQFQDEYFEGRHQSTVWGYGSPDFVAVANAFGIDARGVSAPGELDEALDWLARSTGRPALLHVVLSRSTLVRPKVSFGRPIYEMDPPPADGGAA